MTATEEATIESARQSILTELDSLRRDLAALSDVVLEVPKRLYYDDPYAMPSFYRAKEHVDCAWRVLEYASQQLQGQ